jgi:tetratricopeptide (TPR) repeat protein
MIRARIAVWLTIAVAVWASLTLARSAHPGPANPRRRLGARLARVALAAFVLLVGASATRAAPCAPVASAVGVASAAPDVPAPGSGEAIPAPLRKRALALREAVAAGETSDAAGLGRQLVDEAPSVDDALARSELLFHVGATLALASRETGDGACLLEAVRAYRAAAALEQERGVSRRLAWAELERSILYGEAGRDDEALALARRALHLAQGVRASRVIYRSQWQIGRLQRRRSEALRARESLDAAFEEVLALRRDLAFGDPDAAAAHGQDAEAIGNAGQIFAVEQTIRVGGEEPLQLCVVEYAIALDPEPQHAHALAAGKRSGFGRKLQRRQLDDRSFGLRQAFRELGALALGREDVQLRGRGPRRDQHQPCCDRRSTPHELRAILTQPQPASAATMRSGWMARRPRPPPG